VRAGLPAAVRCELGAIPEGVANMQTSSGSRNFARALAVLAAGGCVIAIAACGHMPPAERAAPGEDNDPWVVRGSVTGGPIVGNPAGPHSPRR